MNREITRTEPSAPALQFSLQLSSTRRGARLARLLATEQLRSRGLPFGTAAQIVAELAANAALHGRVPGRDFRLTLTVTVTVTVTVTGTKVLRIEATDTRGDRIPVLQDPAGGESGRGLLLVEALADRWGVDDGPAPGKTVWAELSLKAL
ncbi:ATP-binding protein [Streptomyces sp. NPDC002889]|uniref:ATP-binding protein n=1 Tax=Streptomyces sp. NPDC002889 TaxID=3364669 RepID=UPI00367FEA38